MAEEQAPVEKANDRPEMATVSIKRSGDEGIDVGLVDHYVSLGYHFKETSPSGSTVMEIPREKANLMNQSAIDEHYRRVKGTQRASVGPDVNLVEDKTEILNPKSAQDLLGAIGLDNEAG